MGRSDGVYDNRVGFVDDGGFKGCEVDLSSGLAVVAHSFADDTHGDTLGFGCGGPAMPGDIHGERNGDTYHPGDCL